MKKATFGSIILGVICWAEYALIGGLNGLTILALPLTMFLGLHVLEKLDEQEQEQEKEKKNENETTKTE